MEQEKLLKGDVFYNADTGQFIRVRTIFEEQGMALCYVFRPEQEKRPEAVRLRIDTILSRMRVTSITATAGAVQIEVYHARQT